MLLLHKNLYHYTSVENCLKILDSMSLRMSPLHLMNDPRESNQWRFTFYSEHPESNDQFDSSLFKKASEFITHRTLISCFSEDNPNATLQSDSLELEMGFGRPRMWAQYSDNHKGVCLIFQKDSLVQSYSILPDTDKLYSGRVDYFKKETKLSQESNPYGIVYFEKLIENGLENHMLAHVSKHVRELFFSKHTDWSAEAEFRYVLLSDNETPEYVNIEGSLIGVIFGNNCPESDRNRIHQICLTKGIRSFWAHWRGWVLSVLEYEPEKFTMSLNGISFSLDVPCGGVFTQAVDHTGGMRTIIIRNNGEVSLFENLSP